MELATFTRLEERASYAELRSEVSDEKLLEIEKHHREVSFDDADWKTPSGKNNLQVFTFL